MSRGIPLDQAAVIPVSAGFEAAQRSDAGAGGRHVDHRSRPDRSAHRGGVQGRGRHQRSSANRVDCVGRRPATPASTTSSAQDGTPADCDLTAGRGADVGVECTSVQPARDTLSEALTPTEVLAMVSIWGYPKMLGVQKLVLRRSRCATPSPPSTVIRRPFGSSRRAGSISSPPSPGASDSPSFSTDASTRWCATTTPR